MEKAGDTYRPYPIMLDRSLACVPHCAPGFSCMKLGRCQGTNGSEEGYVEERNALWSGSAMAAKKAGTGAGGDQNRDEEYSNEAIPYPISSKPAEVQISSGVAGSDTLRKIVDIDGDEVTTMLPPRTVPTIAVAPNHPRLHISDVVSYPQNPYRIRTLLPCSSTIAIDLFMCLIVWKKYTADSSRSSRRSHNITVAIIP
ncbi:hypothetical protein M422DRAFT_254038 [Sphaerobolus stellatus SS14]|uniref:Uncharacterized protein n=1 Tax=Sphaerobolus stellatus (strain SS14) TaxID=990650 RepID=A0A0C9VW54_SPHS4|nr:hypothetical protein M422DRAFT_254038 [Sphaerobolus stellatus SS14]